LHICCGPCAAYSLIHFAEKFEITGFFYNPNIQPVSEYELRLNTLYQLLQDTEVTIDLLVGQYNIFEWKEFVKDTVFDKEGGERCAKCILLRLEKTAIFAAHRKIKFFATTLSISPYKNTEQINKIGLELAEKYNLVFADDNLKDNDGFKKTTLLAKKYGLYRQNYCGCMPKK